MQAQGVLSKCAKLGKHYQKGCILSIRASRKELKMATSSIFDTVKITDEESAKRLIDAIESSREAKLPKVELRYPVVELDDKGIQSLFKEK
jgi:hypothetical protein